MINYLIITAELQKKFRALNLRLLFLMGMVISLNSDAQVTFAPCIDTTICLGATTGLYCACDEHEFTGPGVVQIGQDYIFNSNLTGVGVFQVVSACALANPVITITVVPAVIATINGSQSPQAINICGGSSVNLLGSMIGGGAPYTYSWSPAIGLSNPNGLITSAAPLTTTTYTLTVTSNGGCVDQASITINVTSYPLDITANDQTICQGQSVVLNYTGGIIGQYQIAFSTGNSAIPFGSYYTHTPTQTTTYTLSLTGTTCEISDQVTVQVFPQPTIALNNTPATNGQCNGSVTATVTYSGTASNLVYNWTYNGTLMTGVTTSSINNCCAGTYACTVTGLNGCSAASTTTVQNLNVPAYTITTGNDICNVGCGGTVAFNSQTPFTIQWNAPLSGNTANLEGVCAGTYAATVTFTGYNPFNISFTVVEATGTPLGPIYANYPPIVEQTVIVSGNVVINSGGVLNLVNSTLIVYGNIIINGGGELKMYNSTIKMQTDKMILVKQNAKLDAEIGTFTSACANKFWRGIEVWGNVGLPQTQANQGYISLIKGCLIERAHNGLSFGACSTLNPTYPSNKGGGYGEIGESTFKNNRRDVTFGQYPFPYSLNYNNLTSFTNCNFISNQAAYYGNTSLTTMTSRIYLERVNDVYFEGCKIQNHHPQWANDFPLVYGIEAIYSPFQFTSGFEDLEEVPGLIEGLIYGIYSTGTNSAFSHTITNSVFKCYRGIYSNGMSNNALIKNNSFYSIGTAPGGFAEVPTPFIDGFAYDEYINYLDFFSSNAKNAYGLYVESPAGIVKVQDNYFNIDCASNVYTVGLYVHENQGISNNVAGNYFGNMTFGCRFFNANRNGFAGLQFSCNLFENNTSDMEVEVKPGTTAINTQFGIKPIIGNAAQKISRGNNFWNSLSTLSNDDMRLGSQMQTFTYVYVVGELHPSEVSPAINYITGANATSITCNYDYQGSRMGPIVEKIAQYEYMKSAYEAMVDGGNTAAALTEVELAEYADALELYYNLMQMSPALSQEVMLQSIEKEYELPSVLLTAILASNPSAAKDPLVQQSLDDRTLPLTTYQRNMIDQGLFLTSTKEQAEGSMADVLQDIQSMIAYEFNYIANDASIVDKTSAWDQLFSMANDPTSKWIFVLWLADQGRYADAIAIGQPLVNSLSERDALKKDWYTYLTLVPLKQALEATENMQLTASEQTDLELLLDISMPTTYGLAVQLLKAYSNYQYHEPTDYTQTATLHSMQMQNEAMDELPSWVSIYPNPVNDIFSIRLNKAPITANAFYVITDLTGSEIIRRKLFNNNFEYIVDLSKLATGMYFVRIDDNGQTIANSKIVKE